MTQRPTILIFTNNHFDPIWRRCWQKRFEFGGDTFVSYADLQDYYLTDNLELARQHPDYAFEAESAVVLRNFLQRHPERRHEFRQLAAARRFAVTGAGDNIVDSNMVLGESLVRNFVTGLLWVEETLGVKTRLGVRNDAFGNSAQLPQIFRGCEIAWVTGCTYSYPRGGYWRGLDGSSVWLHGLPSAGSSIGADKYPPCPACRGRGCATCDGRGIVKAKRVQLPQELRPEAVEERGAAAVYLATEEMLPDMDAARWAERLRVKYPEFDIRFAIAEDQAAFLERSLAAVDDPPQDQLHPGIELNPNNSGVWVSRINTKQTCRRQEYALLAAETLHALSASAGGHYPRTELRETWQALLFTMFHDAITATMVDPAYEELQAMWADIDARTTRLRADALAPMTRAEPGVISVVNPLGGPATAPVSVMVDVDATGIDLRDEKGTAVPPVEVEPLEDGRSRLTFVARNVPPLGTRVYRVNQPSAPRSQPSLPGNARSTGTAGSSQIDNERFRVTADEHGLTAIFDKHIGRAIAAPGPYRPNELVFERDEGSPWATLHPDRRRQGWANRTRLLAVEGTDAWHRLTFAFGDNTTLFDEGGGCLQGTATVTLFRDVPRVNFALDVDWDTYDRRLRIAMPLTRPGRTIYGIPYGMLERQTYEPRFYDTTAANGDWPAVNWAGVECRDASVVLLNKGLPSHAVETDAIGLPTMYLSVLRSPTRPVCLHEPKTGYVMTAYDGMRDAGRHRFEYALTAYAEPLAGSTVVHDAEVYNAGLLAVPGRVELPSGPTVTSECIRLSALKWAEQGEALILRLTEYRGMGGHCMIKLPVPMTRAWRVNLLERGGMSLDVNDNCAALTLRPWEIATVRMTP